ncbi:MAG: hypothetical protein DLM66_10885 [Candidatus Dormiibacter spiritus]|nr:MAG: hypothetical protein DLM66_10885 [Candidatus Dormibacteraeota bacterium]
MPASPLGHTLAVGKLVGLLVGLLIVAVVAGIGYQEWTAAHAPVAAPTAPTVVPPEDLPNPDLTPGMADAKVTQQTLKTTVCVGGYTKTVRPPPAYTDQLKKQQMREYGRPGKASDYQEDHLIPLGLGGSPTDTRNLWPQPRAGYWGSQRKDDLEYYLYGRVCFGGLPLEQARHDIASNWVAAFQHYRPPASNQTVD